MTEWKDNLIASRETGMTGNQGVGKENMAVQTKSETNKFNNHSQHVKNRSIINFSNTLYLVCYLKFTTQTCTD